MATLRIQKPAKHPAKKIFEHHKVALNALSQHLGISYFHLVHVLNGNSKPSKKLNAEINRVAELFERGEAEVCA